MDKQKAKDIIDGGKTNDLKNTGNLIRAPDVVIQLLFDGDEFHTVFGNFGLNGSDLDYAVHRAKSVPLSEKESFYQSNTVEADIYTLDDNGSVSVKRFQATADRWKEL